MCSRIFIDWCICVNQKIVCHMTEQPSCHDLASSVDATYVECLSDKLNNYLFWIDFHCFFDQQQAHTARRQTGLVKISWEMHEVSRSSFNRCITYAFTFLTNDCNTPSDSLAWPPPFILFVATATSTLQPVRYSILFIQLSGEIKRVFFWHLKMIVLLLHSQSHNRGWSKNCSVRSYLLVKEQSKLSGSFDGILNFPSTAGRKATTHIQTRTHRQWGTSEGHHEIARVGRQDRLQPSPETFLQSR